MNYRIADLQLEEGDPLHLKDFSQVSMDTQGWILDKKLDFLIS